MKTNSDIGICLVGAGRAGMTHAHNFNGRVRGARLVAVVDPDLEAARAACNELGIERCYANCEQALEDADIRAFVVGCPTKYHRDTVVQVAQAGRHILCEKPMAMNTQECDDMIAAAQANGVVLQIGFMRRFDSAYRQARALVEAGEIGQVVMVRSNTRGPSTPRPWMYDLRASNGPLAEVNSHDIDTMRWFMSSEFETVYALGGNYRSLDARQSFPDFYDNVVLAAGFANGAQGILDGAQGVGYAYDTRAEILGEKGCIFIGGTRAEAVVSCTQNRSSAPLVRSWQSLFSAAYLAEDEAFVRAIRQDIPPEVTGHDGRQAVAVVCAGNISIVEKRVVRLDEPIHERASGNKIGVG